VVDTPGEDGAVPWEDGANEVVVGGALEIREVQTVHLWIALPLCLKSGKRSTIIIYISVYLT